AGPDVYFALSGGVVLPFAWQDRQEILFELAGCLQMGFSNAGSSSSPKRSGPTEGSLSRRRRKLESGEDQDHNRLGSEANKIRVDSARDQRGLPAPCRGPRL